MRLMATENSLTRRQVLAGLGAALVSAGIAVPVSADGGGQVLGCAWQAEKRRHVLVSLQPGQPPAILFELPGRGHGISVDPVKALAVVMARRPGDWALVINLKTEKIVHRLAAPKGRHFYGHGVFDRHGNLYLTENDFVADRGVVARYRLADFQRMDDMPSGGIGPHEILTGQDGTSLIVANGGILTRPETGRAKLNLDRMQPNLVRLIPGQEGRTEVLFRPRVGLEQSSIRHIACAADGSVVAGLQFQGDRRRSVPLMIAVRPSGEVRELSLSDQDIIAARQYIGAVAISADERIAAASAPRSGIVYFWEIGSGRQTARVSVPDGCGLAPAGGGDLFHISSGRGEVLLVAGGSGWVIHRQRVAGLMWDNHLTAI